MKIQTLILVLFLNAVAYGQQKHTVSLYRYDNDDSTHMKLFRQREYDNQNRLVSEKRFDYSSTHSLFFYNDTFLSKELQTSIEGDIDGRDTSITYYYYDTKNRLLLKKNRRIIEVRPQGYGIGEAKGCEMINLEISRKWNDDYVCNYYIYDSSNNLIVDSSFYCPVDDTGYKKTRRDEIHTYKYSHDNKVIEDMRRWYHQIVDRDTTYYSYHDSGLVRKQRRDNSYFVDTVIISSGRIQREIHVYKYESEISKTFVQYYYFPDYRIKKIVTQRTNPNPFMNEAGKTTEIYKYTD